MSRSILTLGYIACDAIRVDGKLVGHAAGGTAANVAANLALFGWQTAVAGLIGADPAGRRVQREFQTAKVNSRALVLSAAAETPVVIHDVVNGHHRFLFTCPNCDRRLPRHRPMSPDGLSELMARGEEPDVFFFDRVSVAAIELATHLRARGTMVFFEPGSPGRPGLARRAAALAHVVKVSDGSCDQWDARVKRARPHQLQILTAAESGLQYRIGSGQWEQLDTTPVQPLDSAGAGDWLTATFLDALPSSALRLEGGWKQDQVTRALARAQRVAALSCTKLGAGGLRGWGRGEILRQASVLARSTQMRIPANDRGSVLRPSRAQAACRICLVDQ